MFEVVDVAAARQEVLSEGGGTVAEIVTLTTATGARVTWCYLTDPEGNMIEPQQGQRGSCASEKSEALEL